MNLPPLSQLRALPLVLALAFAAGTVWAEKPEWAGQGKGGKQEQKERSAGKGDKGGKGNSGGKDVRQAPQDIRVGAYFGDQQRMVIRDYYGKPSSAGRCPPGLAKKNNGCMPPGQAKKWAIGQPLPHDLVYYPVPHAVVLQLGLPPSGHKYVRAAGDILLIAVGTSMVVDAIQDLGRL